MIGNINLEKTHWAKLALSADDPSNNALVILHNRHVTSRSLSPYRKHKHRTVAVRVQRTDIDAGITFVVHLLTTWCYLLS